MTKNSFIAIIVLLFSVCIFMYRRTQSLSEDLITFQTLDEFEEQTAATADHIIQARQKKIKSHRHKQIKEQIQETAKNFNWSKNIENTVSTIVFKYLARHQQVNNKVNTNTLSNEEAHEQHLLLYEEGNAEIKKLIGTEALQFLLEKMRTNRPKKKQLIFSKEKNQKP